MSQEIIKMPLFTAEVIRTKRKKSIAIQIRQKKVLVRAPEETKYSELKNLLIKKSQWIEEKLALSHLSSPLPKKQYIDGETLFYMGQPVTLSIVTSPVAEVMLNNESLTIHLPSDNPNPLIIKHYIEQWYLQQARHYLSQRVAYYEKKIGKNPISIIVKRYKARWGSCSTLGQITFNWLIMMAPPAIIDYVVIHELCHLHEPNHSPAFWQLVERYQPDYQSHKKWLKDNGHSLDL